MPRKPVLAYAIGGAAAAVAAIVITASTVGLTSTGTDPAQGTAVAEVLLPHGTTGVVAAAGAGGEAGPPSSWEDDEDDDEDEEHESRRTSGTRLVRGEREHDDDD